mmetsp:Transcript_14304/g.40815  ORF Transcript_14304/g.40815 Transcript_14304/m.40815 type:complete len:231 (-) Transcript_14304:813-1505(-)
MQEGLRLPRELVMDDQVDLGDVESASGDVRGDEHIRAPRPEACQHPFALRLGHIPVQRLAGQMQRHRGRHLVTVPLGLREDDGLATVGMHGNQIHQDRPSGRAGHLHPVGRDVFVQLSRLSLTDVIDVHGILQVLADEPLDPPGNGGREHHRLPLLGHKLQDILHILLETNVQHLICFVQYDILDVRQIQRVLLDEINHTPRRPHGEIHPTLEHPLLRHNARAPIKAPHK